MGKVLQKSKETSLQIVPISKPSDIFKAKPMVIQSGTVQEGLTKVKTEIRMSVEKCAMSLGMTMSKAQVKILCDDIFDVYKFDSIEDVQQCLKKGRQGEYDLAHFKRDVISMPLFRYWMKQHLEGKAQQRERLIAERKSKPDPDWKPADTKKADEYLAQMKKIVNKTLEKERDESKVKMNERHDEDLWIKELYKHRVQRMVFKLIKKRVKAGEILSKREEHFIDSWNVRKYLS